MDGLKSLSCSNHETKLQMSNMCCCFLQGDQGLPGEQGAPGDRGIGEAGPKVRTLHQVKLVNSNYQILY